VTGTSGTLTHSSPVNVTVGATPAGVSTVISVLQAAGCVDNPGVGNALLTKLATAQSQIAADNYRAAANTLTALLNQLQAQAGKHITTTCTSGGVTFDAAAVLISDVQALLASLPKSVAANPIMGYVTNASGTAISGVNVSILSGSSTVLSASTDILGFYFFGDSYKLLPTSSYTAKVTLPKGYKTSTPASQTLKWGGTLLMLTRSVIN